MLWLIKKKYQRLVRDQNTTLEIISLWLIKDIEDKIVIYKRRQWLACDL